MTGDSDSNDELIETLKEAERLHEAGKREAQELTGQFQLGSDRARLVRELAERRLVQDHAAERLKIAWRQQNDASRVALYGLRENRQVLTVVESGTALTTSATVGSVLNVGEGDLEPRDLQYVRRTNELFERQPILKRVRQGLRRCGLDQGRGKRSALDLLDDAERAFAVPSGERTSPTAVLVPLREAINTAILDTYARCQPQQPGGNWSEKIVSIGRRCGSASAPSDRFQVLANGIEDRHNQLSGGKRDDMQREAVLLKYIEGLAYLQSFLDAIDESRLRP